jgi:hypothetical protein
MKAYKDYDKSFHVIRELIDPIWQDYQILLEHFHSSTGLKVLFWERLLALNWRTPISNKDFKIWAKVDACVACEVNSNRGNWYGNAKDVRY